MSKMPTETLEVPYWMPEALEYKKKKWRRESK